MRMLRKTGKEDGLLGKSILDLVTKAVAEQNRFAIAYFITSKDGEKDEDSRTGTEDIEDA